MEFETEQVRNAIENPGYPILDVRAEARCHGEAELIDAIAGHIPRAISSPLKENLTLEGRFPAPGILQKRYKKLIKSIPATNVICYCGLTAANNLLAMAYAGLGIGKFYAGFWSE